MLERFNHSFIFSKDVAHISDLMVHSSDHPPFLKEGGGRFPKFTEKGGGSKISEERDRKMEMRLI